VGVYVLLIRANSNSQAMFVRKTRPFMNPLTPTSYHVMRNKQYMQMAHMSAAATLTSSTLGPTDWPRSPRWVLLILNNCHPPDHQCPHRFHRQSTAFGRDVPCATSCPHSTIQIYFYIPSQPGRTPSHVPRQLVGVNIFSRMKRFHEPRY
jgi:hypothetical protein